MSETIKNTISLEDDGIVQKSINYFKGVKDQSYRIYLPDISGILMYRQHFIDGIGFMRCLQDRGEECPICKSVDDPITKFKANIIVYNTTTTDGTLPDNLDFVSLNAQVLKFGIGLFSALRAKHKKLAKDGGLSSRDLIIKCVNEQYQKFEVDDCGECLATENERLKNMVATMVKNNFVDFSEYRDRDTKFLSPLHENEYIAKALGIKPISVKEQDAGEEDKTPQVPLSQSAPDKVGGAVSDLI